LRYTISLLNINLLKHRMCMERSQRITVEIKRVGGFPMSLLKELEKNKMIAIIRGLNADQAGKTAKALSLGGIRFLEVTMNTPGATSMITDWRGQFND